MIIYTDGSFNKKTSKNTTAYAAVIVVEESKFEYNCDIVFGVNTEKEYVDMWNVGGELWAVIAGIDYMIERYHPKNIELYYDYIGIGKWANSEWKTNKNTTAAYVRYMKNIMKDHIVTFNKVTGHSNILLNDIADKYANLGTEVYLKTGKVTSLVTNVVISKNKESSK